MAWHVYNMCIDHCGREYDDRPSISIVFTLILPFQTLFSVDHVTLGSTAKYPEEFQCFICFFRFGKSLALGASFATYICCSHHLVTSLDFKSIYCGSDSFLECFNFVFLVFVVFCSYSFIFWTAHKIRLFPSPQKNSPKIK